MSRESETDRTTVTAEDFFQAEDSVTTEDNLLVQGVQDFLLTDSRWETFAQANYQYDSFQEWTPEVLLAEAMVWTIDKRLSCIPIWLTRASKVLSRASTTK